MNYEDLQQHLTTMTTLHERDRRRMWSLFDRFTISISSTMIGYGPSHESKIDWMPHPVSRHFYEIISDAHSKAFAEMNP